MEVKTKLQDPEKVSFLLNRSVSLQQRYQKQRLYEHFPGLKFVSPEQSCPKGEVPLYHASLVLH